MSNAFASAIFLARNTGKVQHGDIARTPAVVAQAGSLVHKVSQLDTTIGKGTKSALVAIDKTPKLSFGSKAVNAAGELVNPLLIAASAYRVATADDKESALYNETGGMSGMFAAEGMMKKESVNKYVKKKGAEITEVGVEKLAKIIKPLEHLSEHSKNKIIKAGSFIIAGAAMVGASIMGYSAGADLGASALKQKRRIFNNPDVPQNDTKTDTEVADLNEPNKGKFVIES